MSAEKYGKYYWTLRTPKETIRLHADEAEVVDGSVVFRQKKDDGTSIINFSAATGQWVHFYAASILDGGAIAIEHWDPNEEKELANTPKAPSKKR